MEQIALYAVFNRKEDGTVESMTSGRNHTPSVYTTLGSARRQESFYAKYKRYNPFVVKMTADGFEVIPPKEKR